MDSVTETELAARSNSNSGLHYTLYYMYRERLYWIKILKLHVLFT